MPVFELRPFNTYITVCPVLAVPVLDYKLLGARIPSSLLPVQHWKHRMLSRVSNNSNSAPPQESSHPLLAVFFLRTFKPPSFLYVLSSSSTLPSFFLSCPILPIFKLLLFPSPSHNSIPFQNPPPCLKQPTFLCTSSILTILPKMNLFLSLIYTQALHPPTIRL